MPTPFGLRERIDTTQQLATKVVSQARRRVFEGENVVVAEKVLSIFEDHTEVIRKGVATPSTGTSSVCRWVPRRWCWTAQLRRGAQVHKALWRFRAGVEGCISYLKRCFGLRRATRRRRTGFDRYVRASILTANLSTVARLRLA